MSYYKSVPTAGLLRLRLATCHGLSAGLAVVLAAGAAALQKPAPLALTARWTVTMPAPAIQPLATNGAAVFAALSSGTVTAIAVSDGQPVWNADVQAAAPISATGDLLLVPARDAIVAINAIDGVTRWRLVVDAPASGAVTVSGGRGYVPLESGALVVVSLADGRRAGGAALGTTRLGAPIVAGGRILVAGADGWILALYEATLAPAWRVHIGGAPSAMAVLGQDLFVGSDNNVLYCLGASNGRVRWRWTSSGDVVGTPHADGKRVFYLALDNQLRALDRGNGHLRWKRPLPTRPAYGPLPFAESLLVAGLAAELDAYAPATGEPAWTVTAPDELAGPPLVVTGADGAPALLLVTGGAQLQLLAPEPPADGAQPAAVGPPKIIK